MRSGTIWDMPAARKKLVDPEHLGPGGRAFWESTTTEHPNLTDSQKLLLLEACRIKDRLDRIDAGLGKSSSILEVIEPRNEGDVTYQIVVDKAATTAVSLAALMAKLIAQLRLPDANGVKPGSKGGNPGGIRAPYKTSGISALEAAQQRRAS